MSEPLVTWSFLNQETGQSVDGLNFAQAQFVTSMIDHKSRVAWLVWHNGLSDWITLDECDQLIGTLTRERPLPPIPPNRPRAGKVKSAQDDGLKDMVTNLHESKSERDDKRANRRFSKNFQVEIMLHGRTIK